QPMQTASGMRALYRSLQSGHSQVLVLEGDLEKLRRVMSEQLPRKEPTPGSLPSEADAETLVRQARDYLRRLFSPLLKLAAQKIDPQAPLQDFGIDSVLAMKLTNALEQTFGSLSKTLFFEYQTLAGLADYLLKAYPDIVRRELGLGHEASRPTVPADKGA